jgi:hypothetical protein
MTVPVPPAGTPVIETDPFDEDVLRNPFDFQRELREAGPVAWLSRYGVYATGRFDAAGEVLSDWKRFTSARGVGMLDFAKAEPWWREKAVLIESDPPRHNEIRALVGRVLAPSSVATFKDEFRAQAHHLLDRVLQSAEFDAHGDVAAVYPLKVFGDALGIDADHRELLLVFGDMGFNNFGPQNAILERSMALGRDTGAVEWMIERTKRSAVRDGSIGARLHALADSGLLTAAEAWNVMRGQLTAGVDTTITAIGHVLLCLAGDPTQFDALRADPKLASNAFEEAVRHGSPLHSLFRTITVDSSVGGVPVRRDMKIMVSIAAANRDPAHWQNPDTFDLGRRTYGHLGFGRGVHTCVGMNIARLEVECLLQAVAERVAAIEPAGEPRRGVNNTVAKYESIPVRVKAA